MKRLKCPFPTCFQTAKHLPILFSKFSNQKPQREREESAARRRWPPPPPTQTRPNTIANSGKLSISSFKVTKTPITISKTKTFLRIFRIWGEQGQAALEKASICLLNCGPTGSEALKNLVLGGIGSITVIDGSKVEAHDLGNNFMRMPFFTPKKKKIFSLICILVSFYWFSLDFYGQWMRKAWGSQKQSAYALFFRSSMMPSRPSS